MKKLKIAVCTLIFLLMLLTSVQAKVLEAEWTRFFGGNDAETFNEIQFLSDGYLVMGVSASTDMEGLPSSGGQDDIFLKYDYNGNLLWKKIVGGNGNDGFHGFFETSDGGYIAAGVSDSTNIPGVTNKGANDAIIVKFNSNFDLVWAKNFGGSDMDVFYHVAPVSDGFVVVGASASSNLPDLPSHGSTDGIIVKYNFDGEIVWQKNYGGSATDYFNSISVAPDGLIVTGVTESTDIPGLPNSGGQDVLVVKYKFNGDIAWEQIYGGNKFDVFYKGRVLGNSYIATGSSASTNINGITSNGSRDALLVKYDLTDGRIIWQTNWGGSKIDYFKDVVQVDDGYVACGGTYSTNIPGINNSGAADTILAKFDFNGKLVWQNEYGGTEAEGLYGIIKHNNTFVAIGDTSSSEIEGNINNNSANCLIVKFGFKKFNVAVTTTSEGKTTSNKSQAVYNEIVTAGAIPNDGYKVTNIRIINMDDNSDITDAVNFNPGDGTFKMPEHDVRIEADYKTSVKIILTESLPDGKYNSKYEQTISVKSIKDATLAIIDGALPDGLVLGEDGKITGTPTLAGTYTFKVKASNEDDEDIKEYTINIAKIDSEYEIPKGLKGSEGDKLSTIPLPDGFTWDNPDEKLKEGVKSYSATFTPKDTDNYNTIYNIKINVKGIPAEKTQNPITGDNINFWFIVFVSTLIIFIIIRRIIINKKKIN